MSVLIAPLLSVSGLAALILGFQSNEAFAFFGGLVALIAGLVGSALELRRRRGSWLPRLFLVAAAVLLGFVLIELAWSVRDQLSPGPGTFGGDFHGYDAARADRAGFLRWWEGHLRRWAVLNETIVKDDPHGANPYVLIPGATLTRGDSTLSINQLGFRGPEITQPKGERFRIVALGESTTFGITVKETDRTWPEVLEARIRSDFVCDVPVEVINAGVPGWTLANQTLRLPHDIFPLEPDLLISYHGHNGFSFFMSTLPGLTFGSSRKVKQRPSRVLSVIERELRRRPILIAQPDATQPAQISGARQLEESLYVKQYLELVKAARGAGVEIALGTFNLAVDGSSPAAVLEFYEEFTPDLHSRIIANRLHSEIVRRVAARTGTIHIDTSAGIDGRYQEAFVDLVHFNQEGRDRLAGNLLAGLDGLLREHRRLNCRPR